MAASFMDVAWFMVANEPVRMARARLPEYAAAIATKGLIRQWLR
jgi:hypothetical protein